MLTLQLPELFIDRKKEQSESLQVMPKLVYCEKLKNVNGETKINDKLAVNVQVFNSMQTDFLRPQTRDKWEVEVEQSIARPNSIVKEKGKTVYARFKWFICDIFGLALVDTRNLVKITLVSKEFWDLMGGKVTMKCDMHGGTAE